MTKTEIEQAVAQYLTDGGTITIVRSHQAAGVPAPQKIRVQGARSVDARTYSLGYRLSSWARKGKVSS